MGLISLWSAGIEFLVTWQQAFFLIIGLFAALCLVVGVIG